MPGVGLRVVGLGFSEEVLGVALGDPLGGASADGVLGSTVDVECGRTFSRALLSALLVLSWGGGAAPFSVPVFPVDASLAPALAVPAARVLVCGGTPSSV